MKELLDHQDTLTGIETLAKKILEFDAPLETLGIVGIRTRGVVLANRIAEIIKTKTTILPPVGTLDITLYRDDLSRLAEHPVIKNTEIPFSIDQKNIFLVDDVLYTGRTIRCALDALFDFGRPCAIKLVVLIDRGGRELPIQADITGLHYAALEGDNIKVKLVETDGEDRVLVESSD